MRTPYAFPVSSGLAAVSTLAPAGTCPKSIGAAIKVGGGTLIAQRTRAESSTMPSCITLMMWMPQRGDQSKSGERPGDTETVTLSGQTERGSVVLQAAEQMHRAKASANEGADLIVSTCRGRLNGSLTGPLRVPTSRQARHLDRTNSHNTACSTGVRNPA